MHAYASGGNRGPAIGMIAVLALVVAVVGNWFTEGVGLVPAWLVSAPTVAGSFGLLYQLLEHSAWKWSILHRMRLIDVPVIEGIYEGELLSSYETTRVPVRLCIDQTWSRLAVRFEVVSPATSTSYSVAAGLSSAGHHHARLVYTYRNQPKPGVADDDMRDHDGTADVVIDTLSGEITGRYFNFRGRQGSLSLQRV